MQIGGLGGNHSTGDHHVTNCMHDHHDVQKNTGGMAMKSSAAMEARAVTSEMQQDGLFSLASWLKNALGSGRGFLLHFWGDGQTSADGMESSRATAGNTESRQILSQAVDRTESTAMFPAAAVLAQPASQANAVHNAGYDSKLTFRQKMRSRFQQMSDHLSSKRSQKFSGFQTRKSFQGKREPPEEDPCKPGRHRRDTVEIHYVKTEDNYLLDSYDRKGGYSRLTTKK